MAVLRHSSTVNEPLSSVLGVLYYKGKNRIDVPNKNEPGEDSAVDNTANVQSRATCKKSPRP